MCLHSISNTQDLRFFKTPYRNFWLWCVYFAAQDEAAVLLEVIFLPLRCLKKNVICMKEDLLSRLSVLSLESWPKKKVCVWCPGEGWKKWSQCKKHSTIRLIIAWKTEGLNFRGTKSTGFKGYMDKSLSCQWKHYMNTVTTVLTDK